MPVGSEVDFGRQAEPMALGEFIPHNGAFYYEALLPDRESAIPVSAVELVTATVRSLLGGVPTGSTPEPILDWGAESNYSDRLRELVTDKLDAFWAGRIWSMTGVSNLSYLIQLGPDTIRYLVTALDTGSGARPNPRVFTHTSAKKTAATRQLQPTSSRTCLRTAARARLMRKYCSPALRRLGKRLRRRGNCLNLNTRARSAVCRRRP